MAIVINGSGTVTGLAVGGLPDGTVDTDTLANTTVTAAKVAADVATQAEIDAKLNLAGGTLTGDLLIHKQNPAITFKPTGANNAGKLMFKDENDDVKFTLGYQDSVSAFRLSSTDINQADYIHVKTDGNVGIGTTPETTTSTYTNLQVGGTGTVLGYKTQVSGSDFILGNNVYYNSGFKRMYNEQASMLEQLSGTINLKVSATGSADSAITWTTAMKIANDGKVNIGGTDTVGHLNVERTTAGAVMGVFNSHSDGVLLQFFSPGGSGRGSISLSGSTTTYATSSDYRLKENVDYTWDATTRLKQLKPARFNFIEDDTNTLVDGFIAHEVSSVVPEAIVGTKDAMTAEVLYVEGDELPEGKSVGDVKKASAIDPQGIDQSKLVPLLVKTIQELEARITALEA
jgi:hypothetical protein